jgi:cytochrome c553
MKCIRNVVILSFAILIGGAGFLYSGLYPIGADAPHNKFTYWVLETLREQSISRAAKNVVVPANLNDADRLLSGGADYNDMCTSCHLKPGKAQSDFSIGLYPKPPNLSKKNDEHGHTHERSETETAARQFWIIKHGIKASGMPAWGPGHDDDRIWSMVAFLQRLPEINAEQYQIITARAGNSGHH